MAIIGPDAEAFREEFSRHFLFDAVLAGSETGGDLPLLQHRPASTAHTNVYVCRNHTCLAPVRTVAEARQQFGPA